MPNLVEQAELVKRLTNDQLAVAMQNPTGAIPPFIFAAEAARRQAIQEQFSGGPKESVVDTLTKQMAKVPQNIQSGQMTTPPVPPTPQMQGVMALQQQQAMQQAAQQAMPQQGMRAGGAVQRYQDRGLVERYYRYGGRGAGAPPPVPKDDVSVMEAIKNFLFPGGPETAPTSDILSAPTVQELSEQFLQRREEEIAAQPQAPSNYMDPSAAARRGVPLRPIQAEPEIVEPELPRDDRPPTGYGVSENRRNADIEKIKELYGQAEPSDWEKAQKWFAASQQFLQPDQTLMQSLVGAGAAFSESAAEEQRAQRLADIELKKALYQYGIAAEDREREEAIARDQAKLKAYEFYAGQSVSNIEAASEAIKSLTRDRQEYIKTLPKDLTTDAPIIPPDDATLKAIDDEIRRNRDAIRGYQGQHLNALRGYGSMTGTNPSITMFTGDGLTTTGG